MPKVWTLIAHPEYFRSLRYNVPNPDERYLVTREIFSRFRETDDPTVGAVLIPGETRQYEIEIRGHILFFALPEGKPDNIDLLEIV